MSRVFGILVLAMTGVAMAGKVSPIEKIIQMISELQQKIIKEGEDAQAIYKEFAEWCEDESKNLRFEIKTAKGEMKQLNSVIEEAKADIEDEETKIEELSGQMSTDEADLKAATAIRKKENEDFRKEEKELTDTVDALERAISILEREMSGGASLMQIRDAKKVVQSLKLVVEASGISLGDKSKLTALLQNQQSEDSVSAMEDNDSMSQKEDDMSVGAPDPAVYESKSGGIVDVLNDLLDKAEASLAEARKKEKVSQMNYDLLKQSLVDAMKFGTAEMDKSKKRKAEAQETQATAEGDLAVTTKELTEDMTELSGVHHDCMTKATDFEAETQSRGEELKALATAKKVIIEKVGGALVQTSDDDDSPSFLQVSAKSRTSMRDGENVGVQVSRQVRSLAKQLSSRALVQLADRIAAASQMSAANGEDPFAKVKGLITTMIEKLLKEAEEEAKKKAYCDKEMSETKAKKDEFETEIEDLTAKIDKMSAEAKKLKGEVAVLTKELADLEKSQAEADKLRLEEKASYEKNKAEMEEGLDGIKIALKVLRDYYAKDDASHEKASGASAGIIGLLEVAEADFAKGLEEMISVEEAAVTEYEKLTKENEIAKTTKEQDVKYKSKEAKSLDKTAAEATADRDGIETELDAVLEYYDKIKEECIAKADSYEEKVKRRNAEIEGLKNALAILEGEAVLLQTKATRHLRHRV